MADILVHPSWADDMKVHETTSKWLWNNMKGKIATPNCFQLIITWCTWCDHFGMMSNQFWLLDRLLEKTQLNFNLIVSLTIFRHVSGKFISIAATDTRAKSAKNRLDAMGIFPTWFQNPTS